jgi:hypothetical protein
VQDYDKQQYSMTGLRAKELVDSIYQSIHNATSIEQIKLLWDEFELRKVESLELKYPRIDFKLNKDELKFIYDRLVKNEPIINSQSDLNDPLSKLLYAMVWKNGDLPKLKHIVMGVFGEMPAYKENEGIVLFYFGRYLTNPNANSIIDQHVIRTFKLFISKDENAFDEIIKFNGVKMKHNLDVTGYFEWLAMNICEPLKSNSDALYEIDKILFSLGKMMKSK